VFASNSDAFLRLSLMRIIVIFVLTAFCLSACQSEHNIEYAQKNIMANMAESNTVIYPKGCPTQSDFEEARKKIKERKEKDGFSIPTFEAPNNREVYFYSVDQELVRKNSEVFPINTAKDIMLESGQEDVINCGNLLESTSADANDSQKVNDLNTVLTFSVPNISKKACTATIIGPDTVLMAGHCIQHTPHAFHFNLPVKDESKPEGEIKQTLVLGICRFHTKYTHFLSNNLNDVALCKLEKKAAFEKFESVSFEVFSANDENSSKGNSNESFAFAGYGCTEEGGLMSDTLVVGSAYRYFKDDCYTHYMLSEKETARICLSAHPNGKKRSIGVICGSKSSRILARTCKGDSGGPLFKINDKDITQRRIVGVTRGMLGKEKKHVSVFTAFAVDHDEKVQAKESDKQREPDEIETLLREWNDSGCGEICGISSDLNSCR